VAALCAVATGCGESERPVPAPAPPAATALPAKSVPEAVTESIAIDGARVDVSHPRFDVGRIQDVFDGKRETLARTEDATTALLDLAFREGRKASGIEVITGTMDVGLEVTLTRAGEPEPLAFRGAMTHQTTEPTLALDFGGVREFERAVVRITNLNGGDGHLHLYEVKFR